MVLFFSMPQSPSQNRLQRRHWSQQTCLGPRAPHPHSCLVKLGPTAGCFVPYLRSSGGEYRCEQRQQICTANPQCLVRKSDQPPR